MGSGLAACLWLNCGLPRRQMREVPNGPTCPSISEQPEVRSLLALQGFSEPLSIGCPKINILYFNYLLFSFLFLINIKNHCNSALVLKIWEKICWNEILDFIN